MQINDMVSQYNKNMSYDTATVQTSETATETTVASASGSAENEGLLEKGNVFEGVVSAEKNGQVTIRLANGTSLLAKLDQSVSIRLGQSIFFQVKGINENNQILLAPYGKNGLSNPTISQALSAAGIPATGKNVVMVECMMESQLSIDKNSLNDMLKLVSSYPDENVSTIVDMEKLSIPVTSENIAQFENYHTDKYMILNEMNHMMTEIPELFAKGTLNTSEGNLLAGELLDTLAKGLPEELVGQNAGSNTETSVAEANVSQASVSAGNVSETNQAQWQPLVQDGTPIANEMVQPQNWNPEVFVTEDGTTQTTVTEQNPQIASGLQLDAQDSQELSAILKEIGAKSPEVASLLDESGQILPTVTDKQLLTALSQAFGENQQVSLSTMHQLFSQKGFVSVLNRVMEQQWLLQPEELKTQDKVKELYERMDQQMGKFQQAFEKIDNPQTNELAKGASDVRSNISFMNQINQNYTYVQIPLKMMHQNAHSDLYVYTNKKNGQSKDGELSAFLHLDMEYLGSTDVSITMKGERVGTHFYMEKEESFDLIMQHIDELTDRINKRGYECTVQVENKEKKMNLIDDFLQEGQSKNNVHRYSFDVKA